MTIEEYDKKASSRREIMLLDEIITLVQEQGLSNIKLETTKGNRCQLAIVDTTILDRFKQLLLERKQELINEFEK